ncbi:hypothetical protein OAT33_02230 [Methylophilaceae bacterium]|nr:hypothetical protein [Methylophilaceae bacterium]
MKQLLPAVFIALFLGGCSATPEAEAPFHPTDSAALSNQGGKGEIGDGSEVDFGLDEPEEVPFHPTDSAALSNQGGKGETADGSEVDLMSNQE